MLSLFLFSCERKYTVENNKVYFLSWNEGTGNNKWLIDSADAKTFKSLNIKCDCDFTFGKDSKHLFIDGEPIKGIDPNSFTFIGNYIFRDKDSAYFFGFYSGINNCRIKNVNPGEIKLIKYPWAKAGNKLIWGRQTLKLSDLNEFKPIDEHWGKTENKIIYEGEILDNADYSTFKVVNDYTGEDKYNRFEFGKIVK